MAQTFRQFLLSAEKVRAYRATEETESSTEESGCKVQRITKRLMQVQRVQSEESIRWSENRVLQVESAASTECTSTDGSEYILQRVQSAPKTKCIEHRVHLVQLKCSKHRVESVQVQEPHYEVKNFDTWSIHHHIETSLFSILDNNKNCICNLCWEETIQLWNLDFFCHLKKI